jgi:hypothetical protein
MTDTGDALAANNNEFGIKVTVRKGCGATMREATATRKITLRPAEEVSVGT